MAGRGLRAGHRCGARHLTARLEPPELFHQILEHRWFLSEQRQQEVETAEAVADYVANVLPLLPEDRLVLPDPPTQPVPIITAE